MRQGQPWDIRDWIGLAIVAVIVLAVASLSFAPFYYVYHKLDQRIEALEKP